MSNILKRKAVSQFHEWKINKHGRTALLVEGARRVGKSFAVEQFAKIEYKSYILIDFAHVSKNVISVFEENANDLDLFFNKLSALYGIKLFKRKSLFIFDEVQLYPKARQLIKYLVADGRYDYIETGSLISIKRNISDIVIPSEEQKITMYPLDFEEFLWAMGNETLADYIRNCFVKKISMENLHKTAMDFFRQYMLVGGMPQAVLEYIKSKNFESVDEVKRNILELYKNDVAKYAGVYANKVRSIFNSIPSQLSQHEKKFVLASLKKEARLRDYDDSFVWLEESKVVNICYNNTDPNVGLGLNQEQTTIKCYMADTGLLFSLAFSDQLLLENEVYKSILFDKLGINEGMFFENIVSQMLSSNNHKLYFYSRSDNENADNRMEIDFLIRQKNKICPVEVKSSAYQKHSSLDKFCRKFSKNLGAKYIIYTKDLKEQDSILFIPVYMTMCL